MTLQERIKQTKKWFTELESIEKEADRIKEWRDMAFDTNEFTEYRRAFIKLLKLEQKSICIMNLISCYWYNNVVEQRWREIEKEVRERRLK